MQRNLREYISTYFLTLVTPNLKNVSDNTDIENRLVVDKGMVRWGKDGEEFWG